MSEEIFKVNEKGEIVCCYGVEFFEFVKTDPRIECTFNTDTADLEVCTKFEIEGLPVMVEEKYFDNSIGRYQYTVREILD